MPNELVPVSPAPPEPAEPTDILRGFVPANYGTTKRRVLLHGLDSIRGVKSDRLWEDWTGVLAALRQLTDDLAEHHDVKDEEDREDDWFKKLVSARFERYQLLAMPPGSNEKPLGKQEIYALRELIRKPEILQWRAGLQPHQQRRLNHPNNVVNQWKQATRATTRTPDDPPTSMQLHQREIGRLDTELASVAKDRDKWKDEAEWKNPEHLAAAEDELIRRLQNWSAVEQLTSMERIARKLGFVDLIKTLSRGK